MLIRLIEIVFEITLIPLGSVSNYQLTKINLVKIEVTLDVAESSIGLCQNNIF